ncbi:COMPASS-Shg1 domain containing protein [Pyrenophora tritici-repentis]|nr:COMPASS-Shg1 domain containing protein [Pyrenophora tritici-repentis]PZD00186.1 COMPASS-Shg1 multi-domain protein [Pyrenophora tritici-repentis]
MADVGRKRALDGDGPATVRKKLRPSELPLSQAKRAAIDGLVHMFQKKGTYDDIRRDLMKQYVSGPAKDELQAALKDLVERETDRNPSLLSKDPRMATTLIEGAGERSDIYGNIMNTVNTLLDRLIQEQGLPKMREYRIQEIGAEAAAEEEKRGSKTEEEWAQEAEARQKERRRKEREEREKEDEERRRKDRERIDKEREEERLRLKKEREEHEKSREARLKKIREEDAERERRIQEELDRDRGGRRRGGRGRSRTPEPLQLLLQESEQMKKSRQRPVLERSESLEPPMRKAQPPKSLVPRDPATTRLAKLESKSTSPAHGSPSKDSKTPAPKTPTALAKDDDTAMTDAPSIEKSRWDYPPELPSKLDNPSPPREERRRDRSRSRSRGGRRERERRRRHSRSRSPDNIDRYVPGGGVAATGASRKREDSRDRKREDSRPPRKRDNSRDRPRGYRARDYDRWDGGRERGSRRLESDCYQPGGGGDVDDKDRDRKPRDRSP